MSYRDKKKRAEYNRAYYQKHKQKRAEYRQTNRNELNEKARKYYETNNKEVRSRRLLRKYGLTIQQYQKQSQKQKGICVICKRKTNLLVVDHCHVTGKPRGLICQPCNMGLGGFHDSIKTLNQAIKYLQKYGK